MRRTVIALLLLAALPLAADLPKDVDDAVNEVLTRTGVPSASVAVVKDGAIVYEHAYGNARLEPPAAATTQMHYSIGSISKQFTAAAVLLLAEEGKLSLDDRVVRWLPELTRAKDVTIHQLLSMTSGYQDFWPQDYVMPMMLNPVTPAEIARGWAQKELDFEPGSKWQYSNTNYVVAGMIVERVAGMPLIDFLHKRIFDRLGVSVALLDGRRVVSHGGEVSGFTATNDVFPDDNAAIVVLTNMDATAASSDIVGKIATKLFAKTDAATESTLAEMRGILDELQKGKLDRSLFTSNANAYFTEQAIKDFASGLAPLGKPTELTQSAQSLRGGMTLRPYRIGFPNKPLRLTTVTLPDGTIET